MYSYLTCVKVDKSFKKWKLWWPTDTALHHITLRDIMLNRTKKTLKKIGIPHLKDCLSDQHTVNVVDTG